MLHDPKRDLWSLDRFHDPKRDLWSLDRLIAWLETKPAHEEYDYVSNGRCLIAQYLASLGMGEWWVGSQMVRLRDGPPAALPPGWDDIAKGPDRMTLHTFGAALVRARFLRDGERHAA